MVAKPPLQNLLQFLIPMALIATLLSCAKTPVRIPISSDVPIPEQWSGSDAEKGIPPQLWWKRFEDSQLDTLVTEALQNNRDLKAAALRLEGASIQARIVGSGLYPALDASVDGSHRKQNFVGFPIPGSEQRILTTRSTSLGVSLNVSWEADFWKRIRAGHLASLADRESVSSDYKTAQQSLAAQVSKAWFALLESQEQVELTRRTLVSYQETAQKIRRRYEAGLANPLDLRLALGNVSTTRALSSQRLDQMERSARQLELLLGRYPDASIIRSVPLPDLPPRPAAGLPLELLSRRTDLRAAEWRLTAADARFRESKRALYPRLTFGSGFGLSGSEVLDLFDPNRSVWNLVGGLLQPVFQGGRLRAEVEASQNNIELALNDFSILLLSAFAEVENALNSENLLNNEETDLRGALDQSQAALDLARYQYESGLGNIIPVLEAQRRVLQSEIALIIVRGSQLANRVDLHLALGGDWETGLPSGPVGIQNGPDGEDIE